MIKKAILALFLLFFSNVHVYAWIYPEHRDIAVLAIKKLDPAHRTALEQFWTIARRGHELRLYPVSIDTSLSLTQNYLDYASWPGIAGDHSTSSANMVHNILETNWIMKVSDVAAELKYGIATARDNSERLNKLRDSDLKLLRVDPEYVTRAGSNNVHFMLARPDVNTTLDQYFKTCMAPGCELNAMGTYSWYHISALLKAEKYARDAAKGEQSAELILSALADEAFAIHFLEDMFASGHVAGTWGNAAQRKGTHDYYDEKGLEVSTWDGHKMVIMGDAYMRPEDAETAAITVCKSLNEVIDAALGRGRVFLRTAEVIPSTPDTFNVSTTNYMPSRKIDTVSADWYKNILLPTAVPGLAKGLGQLPRFRAEVGPFIGLTADARAFSVFSGFGTVQNQAGFIGGLGLAVRVGLGLEGVLNEAGDGLIFLDLGWRQDGASSMKLESDPDLKQYGSILSAIPSRDAFFLRLRLPFYIIPGDLLLIAPFLYLFDKNSMNKMVTTAANGGLIPWQSGMVTAIGRFQFILGREVGVYLYGFPKDPDRYIMPFVNNDLPDQALISMRSIQFEFPIVEYRPFHTFSTNQTASLVVQIFGGFDIPGKLKVIQAENSTVAPDVRTIWFAGIRLGFDWRHYFAKKQQ